MAKSTKTESFSLHLLGGQALTAGYFITTPKKLAYLVTATEEELTSPVMREWFIQSVVPLVGQKAADVLHSILMEEKDKRGEEFLNKAIEFHKRLT